MDQQVPAAAVAVIVPIGQHGFVIRELASGQDKAGSASLTVAWSVDFAHKAAAWSTRIPRMGFPSAPGYCE